MKKKNHSGSIRSITRPAIFAALLMVFLLYIPSPYVVYEPGLVEPVTDMVSVQHAHPPGEGVFMLTTVRMSYANFWTVGRSLWTEDLLLFRKKDILAGRTQKEYVERLVYVMQNSQSNAVEAAYRYLDVDYEVRAEQLVVTDVAAREALDGFRPGDVLLELDGQRIEGAAQLVAQLMRIPAQQQLNWKVLRQGTNVQFALPLQEVPDDEQGGDLPKALGGVQLAELRSLAPSQPEQAVRIKAGDIGGPSAGLIFALQTIDYLTPGDLTGGQRVAGTGTITPAGEVGPIGGITLKIKAAHDIGATVFLAPHQNYDEARAKAMAIGSSMQVHAVGTLADALEALGTEAVSLFDGAS